MTPMYVCRDTIKMPGAHRMLVAFFGVRPALRDGLWSNTGRRGGRWVVPAKAFGPKFAPGEIRVYRVEQGKFIEPRGLSGFPRTCLTCRDQTTPAESARCRDCLTSSPRRRRLWRPV